MRGQRGFVLVNALILVLAISAVATGLLMRAEAGRDRLRGAQLADQAELYLDAAEVLAAKVLADDWEAEGTDHPGEAWARPVLAADIDRGRLDIRIADLQGRLDVNRLVEPGAADRAAFARLLAELGLPGDLLPALEAYLKPGGPGAAGYADQAEPVRPRGGPVALVEELRQVDGMTGESFARLAPYLAALPEKAPLNPNTAPVEVLRAVLPAGADAVDAFARARDERPIEDREDLAERLMPLVGPEAEAAAASLTLGSEHFEAVAIARLEERVVARRTAFRRDKASGRTDARIATALPDPGLSELGG